MSRLPSGASRLDCQPPRRDARRGRQRRWCFRRAVGDCGSLFIWKARKANVMMMMTRIFTTPRFQENVTTAHGAAPEWLGEAGAFVTPRVAPRGSRQACGNTRGACFANQSRVRGPTRVGRDAGHAAGGTLHPIWTKTTPPVSSFPIQHQLSRTTEGTNFVGTGFHAPIVTAGRPRLPSRAPLLRT